MMEFGSTGADTPVGVTKNNRLKSTYTIAILGNFCVYRKMNLGATTFVRFEK